MKAMNEEQETMVDDWNKFSDLMYDKLMKKFYSGVHGYRSMNQDDLSRLLHILVKKGDPVDVANVCMMISAIGGVIVSEEK